jgi:hypothetical protein
MNLQTALMTDVCRWDAHADTGSSMESGIQGILPNSALANRMLFHFGGDHYVSSLPLFSEALSTFDGLMGHYRYTWNIKNLD